MKIVHNNTSDHKIVARALPGRGFSIVSTAFDNVVSSGGSSSVAVQDRNITTHTTATTDHQWNLSLQETVAGTLGQGYEVTNLTPGIASIDAQLRVARIADGTASFLFRSLAALQQLTKRADLVVSREEPTTTDVFAGYVAGSLAKHCGDFVDAAIAGKTASVAKPVYSTQDHTNGIYVRNADSWLAGVDLSCASPWNSAGANTQAGTLISPRHVAMAHHYYVADGSTMRFVKPDGTVVTATLSTSVQVGTTDIRIGVLSADIGAGISFARVLPTTAANKLPSLSYSYRIPVVAFDQEEKALLTELSGLTTWASCAVPTDAARASFFENLIIGASGNPAFLIINNEPVLLTTWYFGGAGSGPSYVTNYAAINSAMTALGGGYQLTDADLSGFPTY